MQPRIFVSSVMDGFTDIREAAREGISRAGGIPILVEDFPSLTISSRNACLDGVASCDALIAIVGERGGWTAPSGKLVVEEEVDEARRLNIPVLVFIQETKRDAEGERLTRQLSEYVDGYFRKTFSDASDLTKAVTDSVSPVVQQKRKPEMNIAVLNERLRNPRKLQNDVNLRFVLAPERVDEVIDPVSLDHTSLHSEIYAVGHSPDVELFSYQHSKELAVGTENIVIKQNRANGRYQQDDIRVELTTKGIITIDADVTSLNGQGATRSHFGHSVVLESEIENTLRHCFGFARGFYDLKDKFKRFDRFAFNAFLSGLGYRKLVPELPQGNSMTMNMSGKDNVVAFEDFRTITRNDLSQPEPQVQATLTLFRRRLNQNQLM